MSKRRKRRAKEAPAPPPELTGVARLLSQAPVATLDLHGYTAAQAQPRVRDFLATHSHVSAGSVVHVITGKSTELVLGPVGSVSRADQLTVNCCEEPT
jgi:hypothetical protein